MAGVHKKNLLLHLAHIGNGKTTTAILFYILPVLESGENVCIIGNEQSVDEFRQMILASVLFKDVYKRQDICGDEPDGFNLLSINEKRKIVYPLIKNIEELFGTKYKILTSWFWWKYELNRSFKEWADWYLFSDIINE